MRRFGWSGDVGSTMAKMCPRCESQLAVNHMKGNHCVSVEDCGNCTLWMDASRTETELLSLPCSVKDARLMQQYVKLSFELLLDSAKCAQEYATSQGFSSCGSGTKDIKDDLDHYLRRSGYPPTLIKTLIDKMQAGVDILDGEHLPETWQLCVKFGISLDQFACLPMHMIFLGI